MVTVYQAIYNSLRQNTVADSSSDRVETYTKIAVGGTDMANIDAADEERRRRGDAEDSTTFEGNLIPDLEETESTRRQEEPHPPHIDPIALLADTAEMMWWKDEEIADALVPPIRLVSPLQMDGIIAAAYPGRDGT